MEKTFHLFVLLPLLGFLISLFIPAKKEGLLSWVAFGTVGFHFLNAQIFFVYWLTQGHPTLNLHDFELYHSESDKYSFFLDFCYDKITAVYLLVGAFITFLITIYSRYYLHRETGYKRFFNTILFFYLGYNIAVFAGNIETLFIGWEILGISSFLLIAFYRDRYLPVKNAIKVFSVYRIGDIGLILAMWASHHLWHENITFGTLHNSVLVTEHLHEHTFIGVFISLMILLSASAKSAQLPFSSWLPRAMEGPTPSSAIFYGSLSVHLGAFLLMRTFPFWEHQTSVRILIVLLGLTTSAVSSAIARVQSSIKSQVAYASISQIGLIFVEIALGFEDLALFHFGGNAFLRTYQLLVSPSVVSYMIREQFYNFVPRKATIEDSFPRKVEYTLYMLALKEWNLDAFMDKILWIPLKRAGQKLNFLTIKNMFFFFIGLYILGILALYNEESIPKQIHEALPAFFSMLGLLMVLKSFIERKSLRLSWTLVIMNHLWIALAISFNENFKADHIVLYLSGIIVSGILGLFALNRIKKLEPNTTLNQFHGHVYEHPKTALFFLVCSLGLSGFPITPTFIGEDLIFTHIGYKQPFLALFVSLSFIIDGLALMRIYARIFLGPHVKTYHDTAYRSS